MCSGSSFLFVMEVNLAPHKTCVVVFRPGNAPAPAGLQLVYRGHVVAVQRENTYLGVRLHDTQGLAYASDALAASGSKAMHALLTRCRRVNLTQFNIKGRMFDVLVEPVLSYASHIWGPMAFKKHLSRKPYMAPRVRRYTPRIYASCLGWGRALPWMWCT
jgi:hypothetical protein